MESEIKKKIVLACSGASNTGAYTDKVARKLMKESKAKMMCLARFSVDEKFAQQTKYDLEGKDKATLLVIDGCPINCAEMTLRKADILDYEHYNVTDYGVEKGKTPVTEEKINEIADQILK